MQVLTKTDWEILNATADDWENLEQILALINAQPGTGNGACNSGSLQETADSICNLVENGLLEVHLEDGSFVAPQGSDRSFVWRGWFRMTPAGIALWQESMP